MHNLREAESFNTEAAASLGNCGGSCHGAEGWWELCKRFLQQQCHLKEALLVQAKGGFKRKERKREVASHSD